MQIEKCGYNQSFQASFVKNQSFINVAKYASRNKRLTNLDFALNALKKANRGTLSIVDGYTPDGKIYSTFLFGKKAVPNKIGYARTPAEASFNAILDLGAIGSKKFKELFGDKIIRNITVKNIISEYTV